MCKCDVVVRARVRLNQTRPGTPAQVFPPRGPSDVDQLAAVRFDLGQFDPVGDRSFGRRHRIATTALSQGRLSTRTKHYSNPRLGLLLRT